MPRLLVLNNLILFLCCSIYVGVGVFLIFFELPIEPQLTTANYYLIIVPPIAHATHFFTWMVTIMLITGTIMLVTEWFSGLRWVPIVTLAIVIGATALTVYVIFPLNNEFAAGVTDPARLKALFTEWAALSRLRFVLWCLEWAAMAYWFYRLAMQARADR